MNFSPEEIETLFKFTKNNENGLKFEDLKLREVNDEKVY